MTGFKGIHAPKIEGENYYHMIDDWKENNENEEQREEFGEAELSITYRKYYFPDGTVKIVAKKQDNVV